MKHPIDKILGEDFAPINGQAAMGIVGKPGPVKQTNVKRPAKRRDGVRSKTGPKQSSGPKRKVCLRCGMSWLGPVTLEDHNRDQHPVFFKEKPQEIILTERETPEPVQKETRNQTPPQGQKRTWPGKILDTAIDVGFSILRIVVKALLTK